MLVRLQGQAIYGYEANVIKRCCKYRNFICKNNTFKRFFIHFSYNKALKSHADRGWKRKKMSD